MSSDRVHVRVKPATLAELMDLVVKMEEAVSLGRAKPFWKGDRLTMAEVLEELVRRELAHRQRSAESAARRRKRGWTGPGAEPPAVRNVGVNTVTAEQVIDMSEPDMVDEFMPADPPPAGPETSEP